jgi:hypothetical protein
MTPRPPRTLARTADRTPSFALVLVLTAALLALLIPLKANAALPIGVDIAAGAGGGYSFDGKAPAFDLHLRGELRLGFFTLGLSLKERPPLPAITPANALLVYGDLGVNLPIKKSRIALRVGFGGGHVGQPAFGIHETIGLHLFAVPVVGIGFEVDFDQTWLVKQSAWDRGIGGRVMLLIRI